MKPLFWVLGVGLLLRITLAPLAEHGDVINYYWWARDLWHNGLLGFYDRNIANAMRPTYPPVTSYLFLLSATLHALVWKISWVINTHVSLFPSKFIIWLESDMGLYFFNKLPSIFADLGVIFFGYHFAKDITKSRKSAVLTSLALAFTPALWYSSSVWGQTDSIYALPLLASLYTLYKRKFLLSVVLFTLAILTKPTAAFAAPIFIAWWLRQTRKIDVLKGIAVSLSITIILYFPFHPDNLILWILKFYQQSLGGELSYMVANAFNFWALVFGFDNKPDTSLFLGIPAFYIGYALYFMFLFYIFIKSLKNKTTENLLINTLLAVFAAFLFLPRMHERYFYSVLIFNALLVGIKKTYLVIFGVLSTIHFLNMYHFWWFPRVELLVALLGNRSVENFLIVTNMVVFVYLFFLHDKKYE